MLLATKSYVKEKKRNVWLRKIIYINSLPTTFTYSNGFLEYRMKKTDFYL